MIRAEIPGTLVNVKRLLRKSANFHESQIFVAIAALDGTRLRRTHRKYAQAYERLAIWIRRCNAEQFIEANSDILALEDEIEKFAANRIEQNEGIPEKIFETATDAEVCDGEPA